MASEAGRPHQYLSEPTRKEDLARKMAERDGIGEGLVCVFSVLEPCRTFSLVCKEHKALVQPTKLRRKNRSSAVRYWPPDDRLGNDSRAGSPARTNARSVAMSG